MSNVLLLAIAWSAVALHLIVAFVVWRRWSDLPLLPLLNGITAACVVLYWMQKWYGYLVHDVRWYATDQVLPLYALGICVLTGLTLTDHYQGQWPQWLVFAVNGSVLVGAALFFTFFRMDRMF